MDALNQLHHLSIRPRPYDAAEDLRQMARRNYQRRWSALGLADKARIRSDALLADVKRLQDALGDVRMTAPMVAAFVAGDMQTFGQLIATVMVHEIAQDAQSDVEDEADV
jgi:hypothetical protein